MSSLYCSVEPQLKRKLIYKRWNQNWPSLSLRPLGLNGHCWPKGFVVERYSWKPDTLHSCINVCGLPKSYHSVAHSVAPGSMQYHLSKCNTQNNTWLHSQCIFSMHPSMQYAIYNEPLKMQYSMQYLTALHRCIKSPHQLPTAAKASSLVLLVVA